MNIVLTGFMASGKTAVGKRLAKRLKMKFIDTDDLIEKYTRLKIHQIFSLYGEAHFRDLESKIICGVTKKNHQIIAVGGGAVIREGNRKNLSRNGLIINLKVKPNDVLKRVRENKTVRPLLKTKNRLRKINELLKEREPYYRECDFLIDTSDLSVGEIVNKITRLLRNLNNLHEFHE